MRHQDTIRPIRNANGMIGDTIFIDTDGSGDLSAGEGVQGVTVTLEDSSGNTMTTVTDANGNYTFGSLDPLGTYTVTVDTSTLPNGGSGLFNTVDPMDDATAAGDSSNVVDLSSRAVASTSIRTSATAPTTRAHRDDEGNHIEGTIWDDTNADGTLTDGTASTPDETNNGIAGVTVELWDDTNNDGIIGPEDNLIGTTTTDVNGDYSFEGLPPGDYLVDVTDEDNVLAGTWHSDGPNDGANNNSQDDPYDIEFLTTGETNDTADFGYYDEPAALGNFVWADDGDGIQEVGEPGIPGLVVTLTITYPERGCDHSQHGDRLGRHSTASTTCCWTKITTEPAHRAWWRYTELRNLGADASWCNTDGNWRGRRQQRLRRPGWHDCDTGTDTR